MGSGFEPRALLPTYALSPSGAQEDSHLGTFSHLQPIVQGIEPGDVTKMKPSIRRVLISKICHIKNETSRIDVGKNSRELTVEPGRCV